MVTETVTMATKEKIMILWICEIYINPFSAGLFGIFNPLNGEDCVISAT